MGAVQSPLKYHRMYIAVTLVYYYKLVDKIGANDIEVTDATKGVILKSANGTRFRITIADDGSLTTTEYKDKKWVNIYKQEV